jgi:hypothetical protein
MIHLEPAFSVTNEAIMELVRISETAVSVSGTNMWRPHGYLPKSSRQYRELTVERRRVGDNLSRLVFASHPDNDLSAEAIIRRILAESYFARPPRETGVSQLCTGRWQEGETTLRRVVTLGFSPHLVRSNRSPARGKMGARDSKGDSGIGLFLALLSNQSVTTRGVRHSELREVLASRPAVLSKI